MDAFAARAYNADVQSSELFPAEAEELRDRITASDAFVIASPEYNASMPGRPQELDRLGSRASARSHSTSAKAC